MRKGLKSRLKAGILTGGLQLLQPEIDNILGKLGNRGL